MGGMDAVLVSMLGQPAAHVQRSGGIPASQCHAPPPLTSGQSFRPAISTGFCNFSCLRLERLQSTGNTSLNPHKHAAYALPGAVVKDLQQALTVSWAGSGRMGWLASGGLVGGVKTQNVNKTFGRVAGTASGHKSLGYSLRRQA